MKYIFCYSLLFIQITLQFCLSANITGKVLNASTNEPLEGVNIEILNTTIGTSTNRDGYFQIKIINEGQYILRATFVGFDSFEKGIKVVENRDISLFIELRPVVLQGENVVVEARAYPNLAIERESPIAFTRLQKRDLSYNYTTGDFSELLENVPGIWTSSAGIGESEISLRGFSSQGIHFMINDIPMNNPEDQQMIISDWAGLANIARSIEIQRGSGFSLYSPNAFGGTINISTLGLDEKKSTLFRFSTGIYNRSGITKGPNKGKIYDPDKGLIDAKKNLPINYSYSARFNSGLLYDDAFNISLFFERKYGDSYILGTNYNGYTFGIDAEYKWYNHNFYFSFFVNPQFHQQAFALQDINLLKTIGREYNRKNHEWQENYYVKPYWLLRHIVKFSDNKTWTNSIFYTLGRGADQECRNDMFDVNTGYVDFQTVRRGIDLYAFGMHAQYIYANYGLVTTDFSPITSMGSTSFNFKGIPSEGKYEGANFFVDQHTHSYQHHQRRNHNQIGLVSIFSQPVNKNIFIDYGTDIRFWRGHRESEVRMLKVGEIDPRYSLESPVGEDIFISKVQSNYDYHTYAFNFSLFSKISWKPYQNVTFQSGIPLFYSRLEVVENPIRLIDFGTWKFFDVAKRSSADIIALSPKFSITNDYLRDYFYTTPWLGANINVNPKLNFFTRIASAKKEPSIFDWYDFSNGPLLQKEYYPENQEAVKLEPETVNSIEIGGTYRTSDWAFSANYYYSKYFDKIERVVDINNRFTTLNAGRALFQGIESSISWFTNRFDLSSSLTFASNRWEKMNAEQIFDTKAEDVVGKVVPFSPQQIISSSIDYYLNSSKTFKVGLKLNYWDDYYGTYTNRYIKTVEVISDGQLFREDLHRSSKLPYFLDIAARMQYRFLTQAFNLTFRLDVNNLLNRKDNYMRAQYSIDYTRNDFQGGRYNWYVLQAPLLNFFFTVELRLNDYQF